MENIALEEEVNKVKPPVSTANVEKNNATVIKPTETSTQLPEKGVINRAMHYEAAMTSPTELLAPDVFPDDITDMNGNAMCEKHTNNVDFHPRKSTSRFLPSFLIFFIVTTLVLAALFTWKMVDDSEKSAVSRKTEENKTCYKKTKPVRFKSMPKTIQDYLESWTKDIKTKMQEANQSVTLVNVVYYDEVIWDAKLRWNRETKNFTENIVEKLFPVASLTKVITALLAYKLHNDGTISLDDPIVKYEPDFWIRNPYKNDNGTGITIRELITYSSGLPREAPCYEDNEKNYCPLNTSYILQQLRKNTIRLLFPPGSDVLYGNLPFAIAGNAICNKKPGGFKKCVQDKIFEPLKMKSSSFSLNNITETYPPQVVNGKSPEFKHWGWLDPAGGLLTTVHDLAQLEIALFNRSNTGFLKSAILDEYYTPAYFFPNGKTMLGTAWDIELRKGYLAYNKNGYIYGYNSDIYLMPELRLAVNVFSTHDKAFRNIREKIPKLYNLFHEELAKLPKNTQRTPVSNPERFIGEYYTDEVITLHNVAAKISKYKEENGTHQHLLLTLHTYEFPLTYIGDYVFEMIQDDLCNNFFLGMNGERIYFEKPKNPQDKVEEFVIYGIHLKGMARFRRKENK